MVCGYDRLAGDGGAEVQAGVERGGRVGEAVGGVLAEALIRSVMYGERAARAAGVIVEPCLASWRRTVVMSSAVWKITQLASSELNLMIFSCSAGSLRSIASCPNRSQAEKPDGRS